MFTYCYSQVSHAFAIIGLVAESTLKLIHDTTIKIFGNVIFEMKVVTQSGIILNTEKQNRIIREDKNITHPSSVKQSLVDIILILRAFYHLIISLVLSRHSFIDTSGYVQVRLNYRLNYSHQNSPPKNGLSSISLQTRTKFKKSLQKSLVVVNYK